MKLIAIAGGSGSGKTTLANYIAEQNPAKNLMLSLDNYYFNKNEQIRRNGFCNFDDPSSLDRELLLKNLEELGSTGETNIPQYCFKKRDRIGYKKIKKSSVVIIEGLYAVEFLKETNATKIFIETDTDLLLARRIKRDLESRGRTFNSILEQYFSEVKPAYYEYIIHQKNIADLVIKNNEHNIKDFLSKFRKIKIK